ncbi:MAG: hypothetical protein M1820_008819 [Bogoriella megaspora]|nr:MAG: hypothetical protein M1820_008819 [Bogoriella megaspora]
MANSKEALLARPQDTTSELLTQESMNLEHAKRELSSELRKLSSFTSIIDPNHPTQKLDIYQTLKEDRLCIAAYFNAKKYLPLPIFNHSMRVFAYTIQILSDLKNNSEKNKIPSFPLIYDTWATQSEIPVQLFITSMYHDLGTSSTHPHLESSTDRFEVGGADALLILCSTSKFKHRFSPSQLREFWMAIACHTSPGIGDRIGILPRIIRKGPHYDFGMLSEGEEAALEFSDGRNYREFKKELEQVWPRLDAEKCLSDAVVEGAKGRPSRAPGGSWPGDLMKEAERDPEWDGLNRAF